MYLIAWTPICAHCCPEKTKIKKFPRPIYGERVRVRGFSEFHTLTLALFRTRERGFTDD